MSNTCPVLTQLDSVCILQNPLNNLWFQVCYAGCPEGTIPPLCKAEKSQCELQSCNNPHDLKTCYCEEQGTSITAAQTQCAAVACSTQADACELDFCLTGGACP